MFLVAFFICGSVWGFLESYLFWFLEDLGSTKLTMGLSLAVGTIAGVPLTIGSAFIIGRLGSQLIFSFECRHLLAEPAPVAQLTVQEQQCDRARSRPLLPSPAWLLLHQLAHGVPFL